MAVAVGVIIAFGVALLVTIAGMDRDRACYTLIAITVATYYVLYAAIGAPTGTLIVESLVGAVFLALAVVGFRSSMWIVMVALTGHGIFDIFHDMFIFNAGMPTWWPVFCASFDVALGAYFGWQLKSGRLRA